MIINVISLPSRKSAIVAEMEKHGLTAVYWDGITTDRNPRKNISRSHKRIIEFAKNNNLPSVLVAEDDCRFFGEKPGAAFRYFLDNEPNDEYDIYLSSYYGGDVSNDFRVKNFCGLTLYKCKKCYYDTFLSLPENSHIDRAIGISGGRFFVSPLFCTYQEPGYSFQRMRNVDDSLKIKGKSTFV